MFDGFGEVFSGPDTPDPQQGANAIADLIDLPAGQRPLPHRGGNPRHGRGARTQRAIRQEPTRAAQLTRHGLSGTTATHFGGGRTSSKETGQIQWSAVLAARFDNLEKWSYWDVAAGEVKGPSENHPDYKESRAFFTSSSTKGYGPEEERFV